ncbi:MAG: hypothetical protein JWM64_621 [Frankiales bacterium]|nr:hypothetical protein [Frankiales bacterium]
MPSLRRPRLSRRSLPVPLALALVAGTVVAVTTQSASADVELVRSSATASDGSKHTVTNHLVTKGTTARAATGKGGEFLVVWAGDENVADTKGSDIKALPLGVSPVKLTQIDAADASVGPDFLAVLDADKTSPTYGKVVNTVTVGPLVENEPHHMQYAWHKGDRIYAGGLFSDTTYVFDVSKLPLVTLSGVNLPTDTPCGSVPDAYYTLKDGTAYGTYMGGPDVPGPCTYTDGQVRIGNGFAGSPGSIVRVGKDGKTLSEVPAALPTGEDPAVCTNLPALPLATCANPHGIQVREDLDTLVASDYAEPRNIILDPVKPPAAGIFRPTVRTFDIKDRNTPKLRSVSYMPDGPRTERNPLHEEPAGIMEVAVTKAAGHKGAFASSMCGGVLYYTPDVTAKKPAWREVFDDTTAARTQQSLTEGAGCDGGGWVETSADDKHLYHVVIGRGPGSLGDDDQGSPKMLYSLDISRLTAAGTRTRCSIDSIKEVYKGGAEADCPKLVDVQVFNDKSSGGPHWGAIDNFAKNADGTYSESKAVTRIATSDYFVARTGTDGDHKVCMVDVDPAGKLSLDEDFLDENEGTPCVTFNRTGWPHGKFGDAKPHSQLFVVTGDRVR